MVRGEDEAAAMVEARRGIARAVEKRILLRFLDGENVWEFRMSSMSRCCRYSDTLSCTRDRYVIELRIYYRIESIQEWINKERQK